MVYNITNGFLIIVSLLCWCQLSFSLDDHQGAFVQTGDELHYFVDPHQWSEGISAHVFIDSTGDNRSGDSENRNENSDITSLNQLKFEPSFLEFGIHALGVPELKKVKVSNPSKSTVRFDAISGSTVHFHCSFFEHKTIEPGSSTTFDVVFLPRQEGHIENTLFIHSSFGTFSYTVSGVGTSNPYRLRPFVGARVPLNGTFVSPIELHNPHSTTLKVTEVYTSGGDLHLELPSGGQDAPATIWEIPPFQTQAVMKAKFIGSRERNATAYIRIKTNRAEKPALIVPVEVEVVSKPGLYSAQDLLDFGTITSQDQSKWLTLNVYNTLNRTLQIKSIEVDVEAVTVNFKPLNLSSDSRTASCIGKLAFQGSKAQRVESKKSGYVKIKSEDPNFTLNVPYNVQILHGKLYHEDDEVSFFSNYKHPVVRNISIWSAFDEPIAIHTVSLPKKAREHFEIVNFDIPVILLPRQRSLICQLKFVGPALNDVHYESKFRLFTNVTRFDIPLHVFHGKLRYTLYSIDQTEFDFGALDADQERFIVFAITNENPIPVTLVELTNAIMSHTKLELLGVESGNHTVLAYDHSPLEYKWKPGENFTLAAKSFAVFRYSVKAPHDRSSYHGRMRFYTIFERVEIPVQFTVEEGTVVSVPEKIVIDEAFPGKISSHALQVFSTFPRDMPVLRLSTLSNDPRFTFESFDVAQTPVIKHGEVSHLGRIYFLPLATCIDDCYVGLPLDTEDGKRWIQGMRLPPNLPEIDAELYHKLRSKWQKILANKEHM